jgi:general stress protein CsbA
MSEQDYLKDISEIKNLMNRSSRFISLSGLSGILAGVYAIIGAVIGYVFIFPEPGEFLYIHSWDFKILLALLASVVILSIVTAYLLTTKKAKKDNVKIWDSTTRRLLLNFLIPLVTGGIYILIKINNQHYGLTAALMLIFYGLALVNASKYTVGNVKYLGYAQIVLGLICSALPGYGFWFWILGFGVFHIIYGSIMLFQEKKR